MGANSGDDSERDFRLRPRKPLAASDSNLPFVSFDIRRSKLCEKRVLVREEEEVSGRRYFMIEATDGKVHHVYSNFQADDLEAGAG